MELSHWTDNFHPLELKYKKKGKKGCFIVVAFFCNLPENYAVLPEEPLSLSF